MTPALRRGRGGQSLEGRIQVCQGEGGKNPALPEEWQGLVGQGMERWSVWLEHKASAGRDGGGGKAGEVGQGQKAEGLLNACQG